jgi:hypothetical protein
VSRNGRAITITGLATGATFNYLENSDFSDAPTSSTTTSDSAPVVTVTRGAGTGDGKYDSNVQDNDAITVVTSFTVPLGKGALFKLGVSIKIRSETLKVARISTDTVFVTRGNSRDTSIANTDLIYGVSTFTVPTNKGSLFAAGTFLRIRNEILEVTGVSTDTLTVTRGAALAGPVSTVSTTPGGNAGSTLQTLTVPGNKIALFAAGTFIKIRTEIMTVTGVSRATATITISQGAVSGTTYTLTIAGTPCSYDQSSGSTVTTTVTATGLKNAIQAKITANTIAGYAVSSNGAVITITGLASGAQLTYNGDAALAAISSLANANAITTTNSVIGGAVVTVTRGPNSGEGVFDSTIATNDPIYVLKDAKIANNDDIFVTRDVSALGSPGYMSTSLSTAIIDKTGERMRPTRLTMQFTAPTALAATDKIRFEFSHGIFANERLETGRCSTLSKIDGSADFAASSTFTSSGRKMVDSIIEGPVTTVLALDVAGTPTGDLSTFADTFATAAVSSSPSIVGGAIAGATAICTSCLINMAGNAANFGNANTYTFDVPAAPANQVSFAANKRIQIGTISSTEIFKVASSPTIVRASLAITISTAVTAADVTANKNYVLTIATIVCTHTPGAAESTDVTAAALETVINGLISGGQLSGYEVSSNNDDITVTGLNTGAQFAYNVDANLGGISSLNAGAGNTNNGKVTVTVTRGGADRHQCREWHEYFSSDII